MIGVSVPCDWVPLEAGDLPYVVATELPGHRCQGFRAEDAGTVTATMKRHNAHAVSREVPVNTTVQMQWLGDVKAITAFDTTTKIWLYVTRYFSDSD